MSCDSVDSVKPANNVDTVVAKAPTKNGVVVGVDGSPGSASAMRWATDEAALRNVALTVVHVVSTTSGAWRESSMVPEWMCGQRERGRQVLRDARRLIREMHPPPGELRVRCQMPSAHAVSALVELSKDADLAVAGCLGTGTLRGRHLGSVSSGLAHYARCPVAVVRDGAAARDDATSPVLLGVDGSAGSEAATAFAFEEADRRKVGLVALHTWRDVSVFDSAISISGKGWPALHAERDEFLTGRLSGWVERYPGVPVRRIIVRQDAAVALVDQARAAQLVVVGSRGTGGFTGMLLGSVSAAVILLAEVPVIVVRGR
jgi:nucleotide-binding universal stress UspA family protein